MKKLLLIFAFGTSSLFCKAQCGTLIYTDTNLCPSSTIMVVDSGYTVTTYGGWNIYSNYMGSICHFCGLGLDTLNRDTLYINYPMADEDIFISKSNGICTTDTIHIRGYYYTLNTNITGVGIVCINHIANFSDSTTGGIWTSYDTTIAKVDTSGNVKGIATGITNIKYSHYNSICGIFDTASKSITVIDCGGSGISNTLINNDISIYPNPSNGTFNITTNSLANVLVTDMLGRTIRSINRTNNCIIDNMTPGIYIVTINNTHYKIQVK